MQTTNKRNAKMSEVVAIEQTKVPEVFKQGGIDPIIEGIKEEVNGFVPDVESDKGRKEIASLAHKIARSKTYLDGLGKDLVSGIKQQAKVIDAERKKMRDELDALKEDVRRPLTEYEEREEQRIKMHKLGIETITEYTGRHYSTAEEVVNAIQAIEKTVIDDSWEEFAAEAAKAKDSALMYLRGKKAMLEEQERIAAEEAKAKAEAEEKARKEREERIAREAAERAKREAEEKARREKEEAEAKAKAEREAAERRELELKLEKERVERETKEIVERAKREKQEAIEAERRRVEEERLAQEAEEKRRQENIEHRKTINNAAKADLEALGVTEEQAEAVVVAIAKGQVANVSIRY